MVKAMMRVLLATTATLLVVSTFALPSLVPPNLDPMDSPSERIDREHRLQLMMEIGAERIQAVDDLLAGKKSLQQTAIRFRDLALDDPLDVAELLRLCHPADCPDNELFFRQVLYYTSTRVRSRDMSDRIIDELEAELDCLRANGRLTLDVPPEIPM